ncbi:hypothetical protein J4217_00785 [Candidatus Pacearchaeota archaeon]|nr:hypothetical protein [Candidatus Pacearchaeota archaeon]
MRCNCGLTNALLSAVIIIFAFWQASFSKWMILLTALVIFIHSLLHKQYHDTPEKSKLRRK